MVTKFVASIKLTTGKTEQIPINLLNANIYDLFFMFSGLMLFNLWLLMIKPALRKYNGHHQELFDSNRILFFNIIMHMFQILVLS